jgi:ATP-binding cassette, subfamily C (CFTR/MRP), member 1
MAIVVPFVLVAVSCIQRYYLRTSRQVRLLDIEAKSPLYTHFLESVEGILSIRAFGWMETFRKRNYEVLSHSQAAYYTLLCVQCWLSVVLDLVMAFLAVLLVIIAVKTRETADAASIGVALSNLMTFNQVLMNLVTSWTQMETSLAAISRIKAYAQETETEETTLNIIQLPSSWPSVGQIKIRGLAAKYK